MFAPLPASAPAPLLEMDRFFASPRGRRPSRVDAQSEALTRIVQDCERLRPHLRSVDALERLLDRQDDPARTRRRISLALALEGADPDVVYGRVSRGDLEAFRKLALHKLAAVAWVFS
jgi:hypothetical protein